MALACSATEEGLSGSETWPNEDAMKHGGGMTWLTPTYDPELNLIYVPTGNPQPVIAHKNREGANLFTGSIVALNPDTGKMAWYFQSSPHDTHYGIRRRRPCFWTEKSTDKSASSWRRRHGMAISSCWTA